MAWLVLKRSALGGTVGFVCMASATGSRIGRLGRRHQQRERRHKLHPAHAPQSGFDIN